MKEIITDIINEWDPIGLFPSSPRDEYKYEIDGIVKLVGDKLNVTDIATGIFTIFTKSFGDDAFKNSLLDCTEIAKLIVERSLTKNIT